MAGRESQRQASGQESGSRGSGSVLDTADTQQRLQTRSHVNCVFWKNNCGGWRRVGSRQEHPWEETRAPLPKPQGADHRKGAQDVCGDVTAGLRGNGPGGGEWGSGKTQRPQAGIWLPLVGFRDVKSIWTRFEALR